MLVVTDSRRDHTVRTRHDRKGYRAPPQLTGVRPDNYASAMASVDLGDAFPLPQLRAMQPVVWINPHRVPWREARRHIDYTEADIEAVRDRFRRARALAAHLFPEERWIDSPGTVESPLQPLNATHRVAERVFVKLDSRLPIAGSIKARGGVYEVLHHAERLAVAHGIVEPRADLLPLASQRARSLFARHTVAVGSTGNLGVSIGTMSRALGFRTTIHMSADAQDWKKRRLRELGAEVVEYESDYSEAVRCGRLAAEGDRNTYFVDDEHSADLFLAYAASGGYLRDQLETAGVAVDEEHPLFVYLPCGVGGGPGGVCLGLKLEYGDAVRCFFVEPTHSPAMILGLATGRHNEVSVADIGLDNATIANGLAVGRPSGFVGRLLDRTIDGAITVTDESLLRWTARVHRDDALRLEPSAAAGPAGLVRLADGPLASVAGATHLVWATGGGALPDEEFERYLAQAARLD